MVELQTDPILLERLKKSLTDAPSEQQRLSFVMGMLPQESSMTREEVAEILNRRK